MQTWSAKLHGAIARTVSAKVFNNIGQDPSKIEDGRFNSFSCPIMKPKGHFVGNFMLFKMHFTDWKKVKNFGFYDAVLPGLSVPL